MSIQIDRRVPDSVSLTIKWQRDKSTAGMDTVQSMALSCVVLIFS